MFRLALFSVTVFFVFSWLSVTLLHALIHAAVGA